MKLDRDINPDGCGKYAILNLRKLNHLCPSAEPFQRWSPEVAQAIKTLEEAGALEWGQPGAPDEFFLVKLKDKYAAVALERYAAAARCDDPEYADAVLALGAPARATRSARTRIEPVRSALAACLCL